MTQRSLSANTYLAIFMLVGFVMFALISLNLYQNVAAIKRLIGEEATIAARDELQRAVDTALRETQRIGANLSQWDEVHQQLNDPTYYVYWRELRLRNTERFPSFIVGSELYNGKRKALIALPYAELPASVPDRQQYVRLENGNLYLYQFTAIKSRRSPESVAGYSGIKIDLLTAIRTLSNLSHIDPGSLQAKSGDNNEFDPGSTINHLSFTTVGDPTSFRLGDITTDSLRDYFVLFAGMMAIFTTLVTLIFTRPLRRLEGYIGKLRHGQHTKLPLSQPLLPSVTEIRALQISLAEYQSELDAAQSRLDRQNIELWQLAHVDTLTGAANRLAFDEDWRHTIDMGRDRRIDISLVLFDCDFFKAINDTYGHEVGDRVIQSLADTLQSALRKGDKLYRLGGDEFVAILINADRNDAHTVASRCVEAVASYAFSHLGIKETVKLSVGIAHAEGIDMANLSELPRQADMAMYHAKRSTREKIVHYSPLLEQDAAALVSTHIVNAVLSAIDEGTELELHYQPILNAESLTVEYYEALARIRDKTGFISPSDIFPIIMRRTLEVEFDHAVLSKVEQDLEQGVIPAGKGVSINISGAFLGDSDFCQHFSPLLPHLQRHRIIVEITETSFITHLQHAVDCLRQLRMNGFSVALDDFGSGYSSIRYLANMPVDIVKFDISMVHDLNKDLRTRNIIKHTAELILEAGYSLVAEGIETTEVHRRVMDLGATHLQGYLFGRPQRPPSTH